MRIVDIRECTVPISRYADPALPSGGLTTSAVAVVTDAVCGGKPVVGYGFASFGRFGQGGLIRERFAPRLLRAAAHEIVDESGDLDPLRAWTAMMAGEKPGGHGERCVAVGTLDMALWDAAAKHAGLPLYRFLAAKLGPATARDERRLPVYASGGYRYPDDDIAHLREEIQRLLDLGYTRIKIKIGAAPLADDLKRIEAALSLLPAARLAVDAMNAYDRPHALEAAAALRSYGLWWFEDACDPLDFDTLGALAQIYSPPLAAGEALFSVAEAKLLARYGMLRPAKDILVFDPVHCYGLPEYLRLVDTLEQAGWSRRSVWPHGGHLFSLHVAQALGLGGSEVNPFSFAPFGGLPDSDTPSLGFADLPSVPGIGFETRNALKALFDAL